MNYRKQPYWALHTYFRKCERKRTKQPTQKQQRQNSYNNVSPRDMVCLRNMCMDTQHKGDKDDDDDDDDDNNNNNNNNNNNKLKN